jgi:hypothetical protein
LGTFAWLSTLLSTSMPRSIDRAHTVEDHPRLGVDCTCIAANLRLTPLDEDKSCFELALVPSRTGQCAGENDGLNWPHCDVLKWPHLRVRS